MPMRRLRAMSDVWFLAVLLAACAMWPAPATAQDAGEPRLEVFTRETTPWVAEDAMGLRYTGPLDMKLAGQLSQVLDGSTRPIRHVVLELDSEGGELTAVAAIVRILRDLGRQVELTTRVIGGATCASGCVAVFMQGQKRKASGASVWVFHGACSAGTNVPSLSATQAYLDLITESGVDPDFTCKLVQEGYVTRPGAWVISGHELFHVHNANIITELLPAWQPEEPFGLQLTVPR
jgi:hypothetical protein